jgi:hypothetical protein
VLQVNEPACGKRKTQGGGTILAVMLGCWDWEGLVDRCGGGDEVVFSLKRRWSLG